MVNHDFGLVVQASASRAADLVVREPAGSTMHPSPRPPTPPQEPTTVISNELQGVPNTISFVPLSAIGGALELQPSVQGYPLEFSQSPTESSSLTHYLNHMYVIVL